MTNMIKLRDKRSNFTRSAEYRTSAVIERLRILAHLSNRSRYHYNPEQVAQVFDVIEQEVAAAKARFHYPRTKKHFTLTETEQPDHD